jgi:hypothetical protein
MEKNGVLDAGGKFIIEYDEEKNIVIISTPGNNRIEISDDSRCIRLADQHENEIVMDRNGISLSSCKDITLKARGRITLNASSEISGTAEQNISLEGANVKIQAKMSATVKGNTTAELSAPGQTTVKGGVVMIN